MSNLSDDTLRKILQQIQQQAVQASRQHSVIRAQVQSKEKERKILELTQRELNTIPANEDKMYRGVGKMFIQQPRASILSQQASQQKSLTEDIEVLNKKAKYLQKQVDEANGQLRDIFHSQNRAR